VIDDYLKQSFGDFRIEQYPFRNIGFVSNFVDGDGKIRGTGFRSNPDASINVAISEAVERHHFFEAAQQGQDHVQLNPSSCGFAAGTNRDKTLIRSTLEGLERWVIAKWIDEQLYIPLITPRYFSPAAMVFAQNFDHCHFYLIGFNPEGNNLPFPTKIGIVVCEAGNGVFLGSRACHADDDPWEHALLEAWINLHNVKSGFINSSSTDFIERRIYHFSNRRKEGLESIPKDISNDSWPKPKIAQSLILSKEECPFFVFRTLFQEYIPWNFGTDSRFVY
jgi:hypothetical protein